MNVLLARGRADRAPPLRRIWRGAAKASMRALSFTRGRAHGCRPQIARPVAGGWSARPLAPIPYERRGPVLLMAVAGAEMLVYHAGEHEGPAPAAFGREVKSHNDRVQTGESDQQRRTGG